MSRLETDLLEAAAEAGGSTKTVDSRESTARDFAAFCTAENLQYRRAEDVRARAVGQYISARQAEGLSDRTLQNRAAHLRSMSSAAGSRHVMPTNEQLGIAGASRAGVRTAMPQETYTSARDALIERGAAASAAALALQRELGLRSGEAVQSWRSLATWERQLAAGAPTVQVLHGTKGGRPRDTHPVDHARALAAVREALSAREQGGRLIRGASLEAARSSYQRDCRAVGLAGARAPHSARYAYARERVEQLRAAGYDAREARAAVSQDLGHGSGRDRWVAQVYLR